jgi:hypothetical protein
MTPISLIPAPFGAHLRVATHGFVNFGPRMAPPKNAVRAFFARRILTHLRRKSMACLCGSSN